MTVDASVSPTVDIHPISWIRRDDRPVFRYEAVGQSVVAVLSFGVASLWLVPAFHRWRDERSVRRWRSCGVDEPTITSRRADMAHARWLMGGAMTMLGVLWLAVAFD